MNHCRKIAVRLRCVLAPCLLPLALSGCIRYEESIRVDANGAGTAAITLTRPDASAEPGTPQAALAALFAARFSEDAMKKGLPKGVACEYKTVRDGGQERTDIRYSFGSINEFIAWAASSNSPFSNVSVTWQGGTLEYSRTFRPLEPAELAAVRANLPEGELVFKFLGPGALGRTDATRREGDTAVWEFKAPELLSGRTIHAQYSVPGMSGRWPLYLLAAMALGLLAAFLILRMAMRRRTTP